MNLLMKVERIGRTPIDCRSPAFTLALFLMFVLGGFSQGQSMFRGDPAHSGVYAGQGPRQFHRLKWKFATGNRIVSSPVIDNKKIYFGSDDGNVYAIDAESGREIWKRPTKGPVPSTFAVAGGIVYLTSYDGNFYALNAETGALKWKFATGGERRFEAKGLHGMQPKNQTMSGSGGRCGLFWERRWQHLRAGCGDWRFALEIQNRRCRARFSRICKRRRVCGQLGQLFLRR